MRLKANLVVMDGRKPYAVVILIQFIYVGLYIISKAAFDGGLNTYVFVFYRQAAATILLVPLAIIFERKRASRPSFKVLLKVFMLALCGITFSLNVYSIGLSYTSATVASATTNSIPVITFFLAVLLGMETVRLKSLSGIAKLSGVALCIVGIVTIAIYKGPRLNSLNPRHLLGHGRSYTHPSHSKETWIKGSFLMIIANTAWSLWIVLQGMVLKDYPSKLLLTTLQCFFSTVQSFLAALAFARNFTEWKLRLDLGLLAVTYSGFVVTGVSLYMQTWCIEKKGPVFLAMSTPLALVITIVCSSLFLGEQINFGSALGGVLMVFGLYSVLWGKGKENMESNKSPLEGGKECIEEAEIASPFHPL